MSEPKRIQLFLKFKDTIYMAMMKGIMPALEGWIGAKVLAEKMTGNVGAGHDAAVAIQTFQGIVMNHLNMAAPRLSGLDGRPAAGAVFDIQFGKLLQTLLSEDGRPRFKTFLLEAKEVLGHYSAAVDDLLKAVETVEAPPSLLVKE